MFGSPPKNESNPNLAARLLELAYQHPDRLALVEYARTSVRWATFAELAGEVSLVSEELRARGVRAGDRVLLLIPPNIERYTGLLACLHAGAAAIVPGRWTNRAQLDAAIRATRPTVLLGTGHARVLRLVSGAVREIPTRILTNRRRLPRPRGERPEHLAPAAELPASAAALFVCNGETRQEHIPILSHGTLLARQKALDACVARSAADIDMPATAGFALGNLAGATTSVLPASRRLDPTKFQPETLHRQLRIEGVTTVSATAAFHTGIADWCAATGQELPLRAVFIEGAPLDADTLATLRRCCRGPVLVVFGTAAVNPIATSELDDMLSSTTGQPGICAGRPAPGLELRFLEEPAEAGASPAAAPAWLAASADRPGELVVQAAYAATGYAGTAHAESCTITDGDQVWHRTGLNGWTDTQGRLWLLPPVERQP